MCEAASVLSNGARVLGISVDLTHHDYGADAPRLWRSMRTPPTRWNRVARMHEAMEALSDAVLVEEPGFGFVAASVSSSWPIRLLVGTPTILVTGAAILLLWGAGTFPRVWIGLGSDPNNLTNADGRLPNMFAGATVLICGPSAAVPLAACRPATRENV